MVKIYTRTGDQGTTAFLSGERVPKDNFRIEAQGAIDELNAQLGVLRARENIPSQMASLLHDVQKDLFALGAQLGQPEKIWLDNDRVAALEQDIDIMQQHLPELTSFILPAGGEASAQCHVCRTVCRRAERRLVTLGKIEMLSPALLMYLNRLSDWLFVAARTLAELSGTGDERWEPTV